MAAVVKGNLPAIRTQEIEMAKRGAGCANPEHSSGQKRVAQKGVGNPVGLPTIARLSCGSTGW